MSAIGVQCPHCGAHPGEQCRFGGMPLRLSSAHPSRMELGGDSHDTSAVARYRSLYAPSVAGYTPGHTQPPTT